MAKKPITANDGYRVSPFGRPDKVQGGYVAPTGEKPPLPTRGSSVKPAPAPPKQDKK